MKNFRQQHQHHRPKKSSLVIGRKAVTEAMQTGKQLERIYLQTTVHGEAIDEIKKLAEKTQTPINKVPVEKLNNFNVSNHEGCVALIAKVQYQDLQDVISFVVEKGEVPLFLILDGVTDIRNIGGIARSAYCFGVHAIITGITWSDRVYLSLDNRLSQDDLLISDLHMNGIKVFASEMKAAKKTYECNFAEPCAIVMGGEEKGIYPALLKICDDKFQIPMTGDFDSLNVSVATGIILYEAVKQRK